jgi:hypothetical protein
LSAQIDWYIHDHTEDHYQGSDLVNRGFGQEFEIGIEHLDTTVDDEDVHAA